jgi:ribosome-binding factor A
VRDRPHRLESILLEQLQSLIREEAADPALEGVWLVSLRLSTDGGHARVAFAVDATTAPCGLARLEAGSRDALGRATGFLRARLADILVLKRLPTLSFTFVGVQRPSTASDPSGGGEPWLA